MASVCTVPSSIILKYRSRRASMWLGRSRATASSAIKIMIGESSFTVHSADSAMLLLRFDWGGEAVVVEAVVPSRCYLFADLEASLTFVDAILLNYSHVSGEPNSLASTALMDETFWQLGSTKKANSAATETKHNAKPGRTADEPTPKAVPMNTASMVPWVGAWAR